jgi:hypothetical protein
MDDANRDSRTVEKTLVERNKRIAQAEKDRDTGFLREILADDLYFRRANGQVVDKQTYLQSIESPENTYEQNEAEDVTATVYEDLAVVSLIVRARGLRQGIPFGGAFRNIRLFLKQDGEWRCVVWFNTRIQQP